MMDNRSKERQRKLPNFFPKVEISNERIPVLRELLTHTHGLSERIPLLDELSIQLFNFNFIKEAQEYTEEQLQIARKYQDKEWIAKGHSRLSHILWGQNPELSRKHLQSALKILRELPESYADIMFQKGMALNNMAILYGEKDCVKSTATFIESIEILRKHGQPYHVAMSLVGLGHIQLQWGHCSIAINNLEAGLRIYKRISDKEGIALALNSLGKLHTYLGQFAEADRTLQEAISLTEKDHQRIKILQNLGVLYREQGDYRQSLEYFTRALDCSLPVNLEDFRGYLYADIGMLYIFRKQYDRARQALNIAETTLQGRGIFPVSVVRANKGLLYIACKDWEAARDVLLEVFNTSRENQITALELQVARNLGEVYEALGNIAEALKYYKRHMELQEKMIDKDIAKFIAIYSDKDLVGSQSAASVNELDKEKTAKGYDSEIHEKEIAVTSAQIAQTNQFLEELKDRLNLLKSNGEITDSAFGGIVQNIERQSYTAKAWERFEKHLHTQDHTFTTTLLESFPSITPTELRVCSLLRMNISNKEIAALLNISDRTVDTHRTRIRKKLGLDKRENLVAELAKI